MDVQRHEKRGDPAKIAREAELLAVARHPGVVELIGIEGDPRNPVLVTRHVDGQPLSDLTPLARAEAAGVAAALASTLADIHQLGIVHGAVAPGHVVLGTGGRPVLCSFGYGGRAGETSPEPPSLPEGFVDPARAEGAPLDPASDVYGLGALLRSLVGPTPRPRSDPLLRLADDAMGPDPARRPTASAVAAAINTAVPGARLPGASEAAEPFVAKVARPEALEALRRSRPARPLRGHRKLRNRRTAVVVGMAVLVVSVVVAVAGTLSGAGSGAPAPAGPSDGLALAPVTREAATVPTTIAPVTTTALAAPPCAPVASGLAADTDGDGCPEALRYSAGVLQSGSARWSVGTDGDQVATGDWDCRGRAGLALLHPETGDVFVFNGWAEPDHDLVATAVARVEGGFALRAADLGGAGGAGCQRLVVDRRDGEPVAVPLGRGE